MTSAAWPNWPSGPAGKRMYVCTRLTPKQVEQRRTWMCQRVCLPNPGLGAHFVVICDDLVSLERARRVLAALPAAKALERAHVMPPVEHKCPKESKDYQLASWEEDAAGQNPN